MSRISTNVLIFLILMNASVGIMDASGLSEDIGVDMNTGVSDALDKSVGKAQSGFDPGTGIGETLFGLFISAFYFVHAIFNTALAAPTLFINLGFPSWFVVPLFVPLYVIVALEALYVATGRDVV